MYCWGEARTGALGLECSDEVCILQPTANGKFADKRIKSIATSISHTLILLENGLLYSCGSNDCGQLGQEKAMMLPAHVDSLEESIVTKVDCGTKHSMAVTSKGFLYSWGDNSEGQLGLKSLQPRTQPCLLTLPSVQSVVQVACGDHHTLALTQDGRVFSWGKNTFGQLGHSTGQSRVITPVAVSHLDSAPIFKLITGADHSMALTVTGAVFVWGRNRCGQLGLGHLSDIRQPTLNYFMCSNTVTHVACGNDHTVFQLKGGCIYTVGSNQYGQLGRARKGVCYPRPGAIMSLMTTIVQQVVCGRYHTILLAKYTGYIISFGQGDNGQLGSGHSLQSEMPIPVLGYWSPPRIYLPKSERQSIRNPIVKRVFAGGDHTFATEVFPEEEVDHPIDMGALVINDGPCFLSYQLVKQMLDVALVNNDYTSTLQVLQMSFSSPSCINGSFLSLKGKYLHDQCLIDLSELSKVFQLLRERLNAHNIDARIARCFTHGLLANLPDPPPSEESLRLFYVIMCYPLVKEYPACLDIIVTFVKVFLYISEQDKETIEKWLFKGDQEVLLSWIEVFRSPIGKIVAGGRQKIEQGNYTRTLDNTNLIHLTDDQTWALQEGIKILRWLYECNKKRREPVPYQKFYIDEVVECCDLKEDYISYRANRVDRVLFMRYSFVLNVAGKAELIRAEGQWKMMEAVNSAHHRNLMGMFAADGMQDFSPLACLLQVRRSHLLQDTISALLSHSAQDLLKPLRVQFEGEEGYDDGGVRKEFFMLLIREILNPDFGMFYEEDESKVIWFREQIQPIDQLDKQYYHLIGMICGLAIYNSVIVDLPFPVILYKKLLGGSGLFAPSLDDLQVLKPSVGRHLKEMLSFEGDDFETVYGEIRFEVSRHMFGSVTSVPLRPNGGDIFLTKSNRQEYVDLYVTHELVTSVKEQYDSFAEGFNRVCNTKSDVFETLHPEELLALVSGSSNYDFGEFKHHTYYMNGYSKDHPIIEQFWLTVCDFSSEAKKKLLVFWTGSNRVPVAGVKSMKLIIQRMDGGPGCQRLPVAHTCSNILDLPPYPTADLMKEKISQAIYFTEGFGII